MNYRGDYYSSLLGGTSSSEPRAGPGAAGGFLEPGTFTVSSPGGGPVPVGKLTGAFNAQLSVAAPPTFDSCVVIKDEDVFDVFSEGSRDPESQQQRRLISAGFNCHDLMPCHPREFSQLFLSDSVAIEAQAADVIADHLAFTPHDTSRSRPRTSQLE